MKKICLLIFLSNVSSQFLDNSDTLSVRSEFSASLGRCSPIESAYLATSCGVERPGAQSTEGVF